MLEAKGQGLANPGRLFGRVGETWALFDGIGESRAFFLAGWRNLDAFCEDLRYLDALFVGNSI